MFFASGGESGVLGVKLEFCARTRRCVEAVQEEQSFVQNLCKPKQTHAYLSPTKLEQSFSWRKSQDSLTHTIESQPCVVNEWSWQLGVSKQE